MKLRLVITLPLLSALLLVGGCHTAALGIVTGNLVRIGGPVPRPPVPLPGRVIAIDAAGDRFKVAAGANGQFRMSLPAGDYRLEGYSPAVLSNGRAMRCFAHRPVHVAPGKYSRVDVICDIR